MTWFLSGPKTSKLQGRGRLRMQAFIPPSPWLAGLLAGQIAVKLLGDDGAADEEEGWTD